MAEEKSIPDLVNAMLEQLRKFGNTTLSLTNEGSVLFMFVGVVVGHLRGIVIVSGEMLLYSAAESWLVSNCQQVMVLYQLICLCLCRE